MLAGLPQFAALGTSAASSVFFPAYQHSSQFLPSGKLLGSLLPPIPLLLQFYCNSYLGEEKHTAVLDPFLFFIDSFLGSFKRALLVEFDRRNY